MSNSVHLHSRQNLLDRICLLFFFDIERLEVSSVERYLFSQYESIVCTWHLRWKREEVWGHRESQCSIPPSSMQNPYSLGYHIIQEMITDILLPTLIMSVVANIAHGFLLLFCGGQLTSFHHYLRFEINDTRYSGSDWLKLDISALMTYISAHTEYIQIFSLSPFLSAALWSRLSLNYTPLLLLSLRLSSFRSLSISMYVVVCK